jgi:hypothetical protein
MAVKLLRRNMKGRVGVVKARSEEFKLSLPQEKSVPSDDIKDYSILLYGKKKIGKTTLAAQFPGALFLMCEPGGKALSIRQVAVQTWAEFEGYIDLAIKDKATRLVVIDTADFAYEYCMTFTCERLAIDHPSDETYGKGWNAVRKEFTGVIRKLLHSGKGAIFISHSKDEEFKTRSSETFSKVVSSMPGQARDTLEGIIDIWVNYDYDGKRRTLIIGGSSEVDAGHRVDGRFKYPNGEPIESIPMGRSPQEGYRNFINAFNNSVQVDSGKGSGKKLVLR